MSGLMITLAAELSSMQSVYSRMRLRLGLLSDESILYLML